MKIFGEKWEQPGDKHREWLTKQYFNDVIDNVAVKVHSSEHTLFYACTLCNKEYQHWLCDDKVWKRLPEVLHNKFLCPWCFTAIRKFLRLSKSKKRLDNSKEVK